MPAKKARTRCGWAGGDPLYVAYHDDEWGVPERDDRKLFEMLILEGAQAGLAWITILRKREGYRAAFDGFDIERIARYTPRRREILLANPAIVRNRLKVESTVTNAKAALAIADAGETLSDVLWSFVDGKPVTNRWKTMSDVPASTPASDRMSKELKRRGFKFVGTTICYAFMQATGMVNDHIVSCHRHLPCARLGRAS